jgi:hypothetical protein
MVLGGTAIGLISGAVLYGAAPSASTSFTTPVTAPNSFVNIAPKPPAGPPATADPGTHPRTEHPAHHVDTVRKTPAPQTTNDAPGNAIEAAHTTTDG